MYGTVAKLKVKDGAVESLHTLMGERKPEGMVGVYVFQSDAQNDEVWMVAVFEDRESYLKNAHSAEQHAEYLELQKLMTSEPEWHDGQVVFSLTDCL